MGQKFLIKSPNYFTSTSNVKTIVRVFFSKFCGSEDMKKYKYVGRRSVSK